MTWSNVTTLVTGAGGFIGSHVVEQLLAERARVRAFLRYNSRNDIGLLRFIPAQTRERLELIFGDLRDASAVNEATRGADIVLHLGALIAIPYSYVHPREVVETNVLGTLNVLLAARDHRVARVVLTSTSEVYGTARRAPIDSDHPLQGQSPYSASKIGADKLAEAFQRSFGLPVATLRPFNTYGPRQSGRAVIPNIIAQVHSRDRLTLGNLSPTRDFTFVRDTARAFLLMAQASGVVGQVINLGSGREISVGDLARLIMRLMDKSLPIEQAEERLRPQASEVERLLADNSQARQLLGWEPSVPLEAGLRETIEWVTAHPETYRSGDYLI